MGTDFNATVTQSSNVPSTSYHGDVQITKSPTIGAGSAAGGAQAPSASVSVTLNDSSFNFEIYMAVGAPDEVSAADAKKLLDKLEAIVAVLVEVLQALADSLDPAKGKKAHTDAQLVATLEAKVEDVINSVGADKLPADFPKRFKDLLALLSEVMNLERGAAIEMIKNRVLGNVAELKAAAQETRNAADKMILGAAISFAVSSAITIGSTVFSMKAATQNKLAENKGKELEGLSGKFKANDVDAAKATSSEMTKDLKEIRGGLKTDAKTFKHQADFHSQESNRLAGYGQASVQMGQSTGHFVEGITNAQAKQNEADGQEHNANAETERASKEVMTQYLNQIKNMVEGLLQAFRDIRDTQDQVKANIAKNA